MREVWIPSARSGITSGPQCDPSCPHLYPLNGSWFCLVFAANATTGLNDSRNDEPTQDMVLSVRGGKPLRCSCCRSCERLFGAP